MPLYEYRCGECQASFEILQRMGEGASGLTCPACGSAELAKQFSTFAAKSAGSGRIMGLVERAIYEVRDHEDVATHFGLARIEADAVAWRNRSAGGSMP